MNIWFYTLSSVLLISGISILGIFSLKVSRQKLEGIIFFLVSFAAGSLLGDVFIHLIPEMVAGSGLTPLSSFLILTGLLVFFVLEKFIAWRHCHIPTSSQHPHPVVFMNLVGDGIHNFFDGAVIAGSFLVNIPLGISTALAIVFHEIPQEIGDFGILIHGGLSPKKALLFNCLSAVLAVLGAVLVLAWDSQIVGFTDLLIPLTVGGFIYIAGSDLIPELHKETRVFKSLIQFLGLLLGIALMFGLKIFG